MAIAISWRIGGPLMNLVACGMRQRRGSCAVLFIVAGVMHALARSR